MRHLPNLITLIRIALAPWIGYFIAIDDARRAFPLLAAAALSDGADGWLSRKFGWTSRMGAYLDPVADKALAAAVFLALGLSGRLPWWLVALVFGRDALILLFVGWALKRTRRRNFPPSASGKLSTFLQLSLGVACVLNALPGGDALAGTVRLLVAAVAAATIWSGIDYGRIGWRMLRQNED